MARTKFHITPESGRIAVTLNKRQLKEFKKMSIEFELSIDELMQISVDSFIKRYQQTTTEEIDSKGINSIVNVNKA